jgi:hypothetical protein
LDGNGRATLGSEHSKYSVVVDGRNAAAAVSNSVTTVAVPKPVCFKPTLSSITTLLRAIFMQDKAQGMYTRSLIVSAPKGGGKSSFLQSAVDWLGSHYSNGAGPRTLILSCSTVGKHTTLSGELSAGKAEMKTTKHGYLVTVLRLLGAELSSDATKSIARDGLLLVLDDIDCIFDQYSANRDDTVADPRTDPQRLFGHHLGQLLSWLRSTADPGKVVILGATQRPPSELLRAHTGCPEFERCVVLGGPTQSERADILAYLLKESQLTLEHPDQGSAQLPELRNQQAVLEEWAERLAGLSAGYLPGDLQAVVQRIGLLHAGQQAAAKLPVNENGVNPEGTAYGGAVTWYSALEAVVSVVPRQLQQLGVGGGAGVSTGAGGGRLSWKDFAGYKDVIADLQRRLKAPVAAPSASGGTSMDRVNNKEQQVKPLQRSTLRGLVIHGPTGCGKTLLASVVAAEVSHELRAISPHVTLC